ncbi:hypothetical protein NLJ89_g9304 [Agrocybe chaxingu]|uniref:DUF8214 domain-containing protein n=1 Tax=Agrocybe chaxingu TaxID=84603 RepID=A0A9W8JTK0_9AGAR|nr:hypothetical protein NLJ89_g9304 [Agrocybe chaxingu]
MTQFIWLVRGVLDYSAALYKEFLRWKRQGRQGCIEFYFENYNELYEALRVLEALPVVDHVSFYPMPFAPTYSEDANGKPAAQKLPVRVVTQEREEAFTREVDNRVNFTESTQEARPNMMNCLKLLGANENMFMISVTVKLHGTYSTHMFDFLYKRHSWYPEDGPWPEEKERSKKRK